MSKPAVEGGRNLQSKLVARPTDRLSSFDDLSCESGDLANWFCDRTAKEEEEKDAAIFYRLQICARRAA